MTMLDVDLMALEQAHSAGFHAKRDLLVVRGAGSRLYDQHNREYIDCAAGMGVASIGHSHPLISETITRQAQTLMVCPEAFYNDQRAQLQAELLALLPPAFQRVSLSNSGAEAVEAALKIARYSTGRTGVVAAMRGFHGRTYGALSATWEKHYREPFAPLVPHFTHVAYNNAAALAAAVDANTAAVILEVVQGEGGVRLCEPAFLQTAARLCLERGALLIIDEIQTGLGRTGRMFAWEHSGVLPDILCLAKALGAGLPIGATVLGERVQPLQPGLHGSTFGGNPLACAVARTVLSIVQAEQLPEQAARKGAWLLEQIRAIESPLIRDVRGLGLMIGIELRQRVAPFLRNLQEDHGIVALNAGPNVLRLLPPLTIDDGALDQVVAALRATLTRNRNA